MKVINILRSLGTLLAGSFTFLVILSLVGIEVPFNQYIYTIYMILMSLVAVSIAFMIKNQYRTAALLIALGILCNGVGEFIWLLLVNVWHIEVPYPSIADVWFVLFYPLAFFGLINFLIIVSKKDIKLRWALNLLTYTANTLLALGIILTAYFVGQSMYATFSHLADMFDIIYLTFDALLLMQIITIVFYMFSLGENIMPRVTPLILIGLGFFITLTADVIFTYTTELNIYINGGTVDLLFLIAAYLMTEALYKCYQVQSEE